MRKELEMLMESINLKANEKFYICYPDTGDRISNHAYYFDELGKVRNNKGQSKISILGGIMAECFKIEKVKPKGRYIPKLFDTYYYVSNLGNIFGTTNNEDESDSYIFEHSLVFRTKEEAEDYIWFLEQVYKYKKEFVEGEMNHYFYYAFKTKRIGISWDDNIKGYKFYFGNGENIEEFRNVVGDDRIKKYMFGVYE